MRSVLVASAVPSEQGPGTEEIEFAYTVCVDSAGRCFDPAEGLAEEHGDADLDDDGNPDPSLN